MKMPFQLLIVEDDPILAQALTQTLSNKGYNIVTTSNGNEALAQVAEHAFDLILTDLLMPHMDGITLIEHLVAQGSTVPIAVLTNLMRPDVHERLKAMHVDHHFIKTDTPLEEIARYVEERCQSAQT